MLHFTSENVYLTTLFIHCCHTTPVLLYFQTHGIQGPFLNTLGQRAHIWVPHVSIMLVLPKLQQHYVETLLPYPRSMHEEAVPYSGTCQQHTHAHTRVRWLLLVERPDFAFHTPPDDATCKTSRNPNLTLTSTHCWAILLSSHPFCSSTFLSYVFMRVQLNRDILTKVTSTDRQVLERRKASRGLRRRPQSSMRGRSNVYPRHTELGAGTVVGVGADGVTRNLWRK